MEIQAASVVSFLHRGNSWYPVISVFVRTSRASWRSRLHLLYHSCSAVLVVSSDQCICPHFTSFMEIRAAPDVSFLQRCSFGIHDQCMSALHELHGDPGCTVFILQRCNSGTSDSVCRTHELHGDPGCICCIILAPRILMKVADKRRYIARKRTCKRFAKIPGSYSVDNEMAEYHMLTTCGRRPEPRIAAARPHLAEANRETFVISHRAGLAWRTIQ
ncbi:hypothetical protein J6590_035423 [Homalodisca vitripennis]|nr:hypothetical protein J6590_035423 [Homalodisca vitripennis]